MIDLKKRIRNRERLKKSLAHDIPDALNILEKAQKKLVEKSIPRQETRG